MTRRTTRPLKLWALIVPIVATAAWFVIEPAIASQGQPALAPAPVSADTAASITDLLGKITVVQSLPSVPGYERSCKKGKACSFGPAWTDVARSGCDTRNQILRSQLSNVRFKPGTRDCKVLSGTLDDPYSGTRIEFSASNPKAVEIDHIAALALAWRSGASTWTPQQRLNYANDPQNLLAVDGPLNVKKSDSSISQWLPPNRDFQCTYIQKFLAIAAKYGLSITQADKTTALNTCPTTASF